MPCDEHYCADEYDDDRCFICGARVGFVRAGRQLAVDDLSQDPLVNERGMFDADDYYDN